MKKKYESKDIRVLQEIEHIRLNPAMYVGELSNPVHLFEELLDNSIDEALAGFATKIEITIDTKTKECSVSDNGRGIPIEDNIAITLSSKLFSGAKFQDQKTVYDISAGLHGVGLVAVNALSQLFKIEIFRDGRHALYKFENTKIKNASNEKYKGAIPFATKVSFIADKKIFETCDLDLERVRKRLLVASAELNDVIFILDIDGKVEKIKHTLEEYFKEEIIKNAIFNTVIQFCDEKPPEIFNIIMTYVDDNNQQKVSSSVNLLPVEGGGTHISFFTDILKEVFMHKAKKYNLEFRENDCLIGLRAYIILRIMSPQFAGQMKERLVNKKESFDKFYKLLKAKLKSFCDENEEYTENLLKRFDEYRTKQDSKKITSNGFKKRVSTGFTKLRDCIGQNGELFIVEGDSAGGSLIQCRDRNIHAVLPLKGKSIPNIVTKKDIFKNREVEELVRAIGAGVEPYFDINKMRYDKIICAADADQDGAHIACLLTMVIAVLMPNVIRKKRYFIARTPLFAINEGKTFIPLWSEKELEKAQKENRNISRFKGLGELSPNQLKTCLIDKKHRNLILVSFSKDIETLSNLFGSVEEKRRLLDE